LAFFFGNGLCNPFPFFYFYFLKNGLAETEPRIRFGCVFWFWSEM